MPMDGNLEISIAMFSELPSIMPQIYRWNWIGQLPVFDEDAIFEQEEQRRLPW